MGTPPESCDLCDAAITRTFVDGKTAAGPWGILCGSCHTTYGVGLGVGKGQQYTKQGGVQWLKVAG